MKRLLLFLILLSAPFFLKSQSLSEYLTLKRLDNTEVQVKDLLDNEDGFAVLVFWATWCKPCQSELEALADIQDDWKGKIKIIAISTDDARTLSKVKSLVNGKKWPYEVLLDSNRDLYKALHLTSIPFAMIVSNGKTVWTHNGYMPGDEEILVQKALAVKKTDKNPEQKEKFVGKKKKKSEKQK